MHALIHRKLHRAALAASHLVLALTPVIAGAAIFEDDEARRAIIDLRGRLEVLDRDNRKRFDELDRQTSTQLTTQISLITARLDRLEQGARGQLDLQNQIEALRQELARLRGQLEVLARDLAETQRGQRDLAGSIDNRPKAADRVEVQIDSKPVLVQPEERRLFDGALAQVRGGDFGAAITGFQVLRITYPDTPYAASAVFWTGSAQFAQRDYGHAASTLQWFLAKYPDHPRAADAWLNIGLSQLEGGDKKAARKSLETVRDRFPDSQAAQIARERLAQLK